MSGTTDPGGGVTELTLIADEPDAPYLAVDVLPDNVPGTFLVDVSEVDGLDLLGWGMDGWLNIVCDVDSIDISRGATRLQGALTRTEAGTAQVSLQDTSRRFDPMVNADAIHPGTPVRVRAWTWEWESVLFTGRIGQDLDVTYAQTGPPQVTFTAVDLISPLARFEAIGRPDPGVGAGDDLLERVTRVLEEVGLDETSIASDVDATYVATLASSPLATGWGTIAAAEDAELGRVWINAADQIVTRARGSELSGTVRGTLSDVHGEEIADAVHCCYRDPVVRYGTESLTNRAVAARRVPDPGDESTPAPSALVQVDDTYSQARWTGGVAAAHVDRSLDLESDAQLQPWGEWLVMLSAEPELRVDSVAIAPRDAPDAWPAVCATDIGDRWYFRMRPEVGPAVERTLGVLGIRHAITPQSWETVLTTVEAPTPGVENPSGWFTVDLSYVDDGDVLAPFGGAVPA
jgi:hypothetical protein